MARRRSVAYPPNGDGGVPAVGFWNLLEAYAEGGTGLLVSQVYGPHQVVTRGTLYRTRNWGRTWRRVTWRGFAPRHLTALDLVTPRLGFAETGAGDHTFWVTTDGGQVWHPVTPPNRAGP